MGGKMKMGVWLWVWLAVGWMVVRGCVGEDVLSVVKEGEDSKGGGKDVTSEVLSHGQEILSRFESVFLAMIIPVGLVGSMFGIVLFKAFLVIAGSTVGGAFTYMFMVALTKDTSLQLVGPIVLGSLAAIIFGFLAYKLAIVGVFAIGSSLGVGLALLLSTTRFYDSANPENPRKVLLITMVLLGLITGAASLFVQRPMIIITMAYSGSLMTVYGLGHTIGDFPDLQEVNKPGFFKSTKLWLWFLLFVVQAGIGMYIQFRIMQRGASDVESMKREEDGTNSFYFHGGNDGAADSEDDDSVDSGNMDWNDSWDEDHDDHPTTSHARDRTQGDIRVTVDHGPSDHTPGIRRLEAGRIGKKD